MGHENTSFVHVHINKDTGDVTGRFWESFDQETFHIRPSTEEGQHMIYAESIEGQTHGTCGVDGEKDEAHSNRNRRGVSATPYTLANQAKMFERNETICEMALYADGKFVNQYGKDKVVNIMVERLAAAQAVMDSQHTVTTNSKSTDFNNWASGIGQVRVVLQIKWLDFYINDAASSADAKIIDDLVKGETETKEFLEAFSKFDWSPYCLAHIFTYKDFTGTLGLAWTGYPKSANHNGGICQARYNDASKGGMSLNTAWHSALNFGSTQLEGQSALVLAHEIGHNFGAQHDPETTTPPDSGNYVMYKFAVSGTKSNNKKFSPASIATMGEVMTDRAGCFVNNSVPTCGNGIVEDGEVCDCGSTNPVECTRRDPCCSPGVCTEYKDNTTLSCSPKDPSKGGCCSDTCKLDTTGAACGVETECKLAGVCTIDTNSPCSAGDPKQDGTFCEVGLSLSATATSATVCAGGECTKSICVYLGLEDCAADEIFGEEKACNVYCKSAGSCDLLSTITTVDKSKEAYKKGVKYPLDATALASLGKPAGASCAHIKGDELSGVCNSDNKCIKADTEEDTLAELRKQYEQFKDTFLSWVGEDTAGVPRYVWLIIGGVVLILLCCGGCYVANKDEVVKTKKQLGRRMSKSKGKPGGQNPNGI